MRDFKGREVVSSTHLSNCLLYALATAWLHGGRLRWERGTALGGVLPHCFVAMPGGTRREFVWGLRGWRAPWLVFRGYGVEVPDSAYVVAPAVKPCCGFPVEGPCPDCPDVHGVGIPDGSQR
jgi:hypothetical protein